MRFARIPLGGAMILGFLVSCGDGATEVPADRGRMAPRDVIDAGDHPEDAGDHPEDASDHPEIEPDGGPIEKGPEWQCSEEQIADVRAWDCGQFAVESPVGNLEDAPFLTKTDCQTIVEWRRLTLKQQGLSDARATRLSVLRQRCLSPSELRDLDPRPECENPWATPSGYPYDAKRTSETLGSSSLRPGRSVNFGSGTRYIAARQVGPFVYTVIHQQPWEGSVPSSYFTGPSDLERKYQGWKHSFENFSFGEPVVSERDENRTDHAAACDEAFVARGALANSFVSLLAFDMNAPGPLHQTLIAIRPSIVYLSPHAMYLVTEGTEGSWKDRALDDAPEKLSTIQKFALEGLATRYVGSATVPGRVSNAASMDEQDGVLRIVTSNRLEPEGFVSNVSTITEGGDALTVLGALSDIPSKQAIQSVRFDGSRAHLSFEDGQQVAIDLSDSHAPKLLL